MSTTIETPNLIRQEDMRHPPYVWTDPSFAEEPLRKLLAEWRVHLLGRSNPVSKDTEIRYGKAFESYIRSIERASESATLGNLTPHTINRWIGEQRAAGNSEDTVAIGLSAVKIFALAYVYKHLELTTTDLLRKVHRIEPPERDAEVLNRDELERLMQSFNKPTFEDRRNAAFLAILIATGTRFKEVMGLRVSDFDPVTTEITVVGKGDDVRYAQLSTHALKALRAYLKLRPSGLTDRLWVTRDGTPASKWAIAKAFYNLKGRSGIARFHPHLLRHTFGSHAIDSGAERAAVQDMLGHKTDRMSQHYTRAARRRTASRMVAQYSPL